MKGGLQNGRSHGESQLDTRRLPAYWSSLTRQGFRRTLIGQGCVVIACME
jgi:hypothetical protein